MQGDSHFEYDAYGNLRQERRGTGQRLTRDYRYDSQQRLSGITLPDGSQVTYRYDAFGRRISKDHGGTTTQYLWQGERLIAESAQQKGLRGISHYCSYLYEPGTFKPLALLQGEGDTAQAYHYQLDHLGTPQELTDHRGQIVWSAHYRAYGNVHKLDKAEITNPLRFQGQYYDEESGLHYNRHRYYNPNTGRYLTPDPIKLAGGLNSYQYVPNPTGWVDPLGLSSIKGRCPGQADSEPKVEQPEAQKSNSHDDPVTPAPVLHSQETQRVRHYTNRRGSTGIEQDGMITAKDNNRVYVESARKKALDQQSAEEKYQIGRGRGRDYVEFDVPVSQLEEVKNPRYGAVELTIKGSVKLECPEFFRRK